MYPHWPSSTIRINKTWLHVKKRSKKVMNHVIFSQPTNRTYCLNMAISKEKNNLDHMASFGAFFLQKTFV